jgi:UDP-N-acetylmuramoyl-L-alanyl-D-glutamate--2,6-diaminopimelate ligase
MKLSALARFLKDAVVAVAGRDPEIGSVTHDSRKVTPGALFCAFPGRVADGKSFLPEAIARGAAACLGLPPAAEGIPYVATPRPREAAALCAAALAGHPAEKLVMAGITGTSGKTTTTLLVERILSRVHPVTGLFGTLVYRGGRQDVEAARTTPEATDLQAMLGDLVADGGSAAVMECSSHALVLDRLTGCSFDAAVFLNLSRDHLDFHGSMEEYFEAKARLFSLLKPGGLGVVNADDPYGQRILARFPERTWGFSFDNDSYARIFGVYRIGKDGLRMVVIDRGTGLSFEFLSWLPRPPDSPSVSLGPRSRPPSNRSRRSLGASN